MTAASIDTWGMSWKTMRKRPFSFFFGGGAWSIFFVMPLFLGLLLKAVFDGISDERTATYFWIVIGAYAGVAIARRTIVHFGALLWARFWSVSELILRGGMLRGQVSSGGRHAGRPVEHAGAAMTRFRDDPQDVVRFIDSWVDIAGALAFGGVAVAVMASIDVWLTVVVMLPVAAIALTTRVLGHWVTSAHRRHLEKTSHLTACLRDVFAAQNTIRLYDRRQDATAEVGRRAAERSKAAIVDHILTDSIRAISLSLTEVAVGIMLLVVASDLRNGAFSVGDLALFTAYLGYISFLPRMTGHLLTRRRQTEVAFDRMRHLVAEEKPENILADFDLGIDGGTSTATERPCIRRQPLQTLEVRDLSSTFANSEGVVDANFALQRGTLTVVTGHVGAGKTTLLRAMLGLIPSTGTLLWNGAEVRDLGAFMTPPHCAYLPQSPRLFSDTLADNVRLGHDTSSIDKVLATAGLAGEVEAMHEGQQTLVGPRGVRLSGGQRQRLGLARALYTSPELLVLDDLSSAVDADTEVALWHDLRASGATILAVSNRPLAIATADQVLSLNAGTLTQ